MPRPRKNRHEQQFEEAARADGWNVTKRGWPDFFCWRRGANGKMQLLFVEVKPESKTQPGHYARPTDAQMLVLGTLYQAGIDVRISDGSDLGASWDRALLSKSRSRKSRADFTGVRTTSRKVRQRDEHTEETIRNVQTLTDAHGTF